MIEKHFTLELDNTHTITCVVSVPYSNCIRLEYRDESKQLLETGYKCEHLGVCETPLVFMQTIELTVISTIEKLTKRKVIGISKCDTTYKQEDLELAEKWCKFLSVDRKSTRLNSSHSAKSRMPSSA